MKLQVVATLKEALGHLQTGEQIKLVEAELTAFTQVVAHILVGDGVTAEGKVTLTYTTAGITFHAEVTDNSQFLPGDIQLPTITEPVAGFLAQIVEAVVADGVAADVTLSASIVSDTPTAAPAVAAAEPAPEHAAE